MNVHSLFTGVANAYIVETGSGVVLVDAGMPHQARRIMRKLRELGHVPRDVRLIYLTHGHIDHAGSAAALKRLTGAPVALHALDVPLVATPDLKIPPGRSGVVDALGRFVVRFGWVMPLETFAPDICVEDGQSLQEYGVAARAIHTPGHTAGSTTLAFEDGTVFVGDAILNLVRVSFPLWWDNPAAAGASACKIQALEPRICYSGHGRAFDLAQLKTFVAHHCTAGD